MPTLKEQAIAAIRPAAFRVGADLVREGDKLRAEGGVSYDRHWSTGWGVTAYGKAYWTDKPIVPVDRFGYVVGFEVGRKF